VVVGSRIEEPLSLAASQASEEQVLEAVLVSDESESLTGAKKT